MTFETAPGTPAGDSAEASAGGAPDRSAQGELAGVRAVVTGGASGIGAAIVRGMLARGATVTSIDRVTDGVPAGAGAQVADVTDDAAVRAAVVAAAEAMGGIDVVANNAGIGAQGTVADNDDAEWLRVLDVNVLGIVRVTRAALPYLRESPHAAVVNTCSIAAWTGLPNRALYSASKGAVQSLTLAMATDHVRRGHPRQLRQPRHRRHPVGDQAARRRRRPRRGTRRPGGPPALGPARQRGRGCACRLLPREPARRGYDGRDARRRRRIAHAAHPRARAGLSGTELSPESSRGRDTMETTTVRATGIRLTTLGLGAAPAGNLYRAIADEDAHATFEAAWAAGIRYFDTAPHYGLGLSERRLGAYLRTRPRDELVVSTKVGRLLVPSPETAHRTDPDIFEVPAASRRVWDFSRDGVLRSLEASLERTGLDRVDVVYLHDPDEHWEQAAHEALPALFELRDQGVIGAVGAGMNQSAMLTRFVRETDIDVVMCAGRFTLLEQAALTDLLPAATERGVAVRGRRAVQLGHPRARRPAVGRHVRLRTRGGGPAGAGPADRRRLRGARRDAPAGGARLRAHPPGGGEHRRRARDARAVAAGRGARRGAGAGGAVAVAGRRRPASGGSGPRTMSHRIYRG